MRKLSRTRPRRDTRRRDAGMLDAAHALRDVSVADYQLLRSCPWCGSGGMQAATCLFDAGRMWNVECLYVGIASSGTLEADPNANDRTRVGRRRA